MKFSPHLRIRLLSIFICMFGLGLVGRLYFLQIVHGAEYSERAEKQYVSPTQSLFARGSIFFESKDGDPLNAATLKIGFTISINPRLLKNPEDAYNKLSAILPIGKTIFLTKAAKADDPYEEIAKKIDQDVADKISALKISGLEVHKEKWRFYPAGSLASHVIGFVGYQGDILEGRYGLENYYNSLLERKSDGLYTNFFAEIFSNIQKTVIKGSDLEGDIVTTIEPTVETFLESELAKIDEKWHPELIGGIIMDPRTGEVRAMAVLPSFDPNNFGQEKNNNVFTNPIVESVYEMGSIIKPLTMAAGIDSHAVTAETTYFDEGYLVLNNSRISNFDGKGRGTVNMQEVLNQSLNTGVAFVMQKMGKEKFSKYMLSYGFGEETGIDLPNEAAGLVSNLESPRDIEHATASYGQGIAMTPINTVRALSVLANEGKLPNPHLVKEINYKVGFSKETDFGESKQIIKKETAEEVTRMLVEVVDKALLEGKVKIKNYSVAAKTGTAQIAKKDGRGYYDDRYLHSFFGYFPAYNPKFIVFLYAVNPGEGVKYASQTLTNPFIDITKFLINYYEIVPDR